MNIEDLTYGIELEFETNKSTDGFNNFLKTIPDDVRSLIRGESYNHRTRDYWKLTTDGSLINGFELVSPILKGENGLLEIQKILNGIAETDAYINSRCGFHVHIGVPNVVRNDINFFKRLMFLYIQFEDLIDSMMPSSRRGNNNSYCQGFLKSKVTHLANITTLNKLISTCNRDRYYKLNLQSYFLHGTVEFRHHSGTLEYNKIKNWIDICRNIVLAAMTDIPIDNISYTREELLNIINNENTYREGSFNHYYGYFSDSKNKLMTFLKSNVDLEMSNKEFKEFTNNIIITPLHRIFYNLGIPFKRIPKNGRTYYKFVLSDIQKEIVYDLNYFQQLIPISDENLSHIKNRIEELKPKGYSGSTTDLAFNDGI